MQLRYNRLIRRHFACIPVYVLLSGHTYTSVLYTSAAAATAHLRLVRRHFSPELKQGVSSLDCRGLVSRQT